MRELSPKQAAFCREYIIDLNATQAAIRAEYSKKTAQVIGSENLSKPIISQEIQRLMDIRSKKTELTAEKVLVGIAEVIKDAKLLKQTEAGETMNNHTAALKGYELLGKHLAMWTDKKIVETKVSFEDTLKDLLDE